MKTLLSLVAFLMLFSFKISAQKVTKTDTAKQRITQVVFMPPPPKTVSSKDIAKHMGEYVTVCDKVFTTRLIEGSNITLLNLGGSYPNQTLTIMIPAADRGKFKEQPENYFKGRNVCVSGKVIDYKGKPEIIVSDPLLLNLELMDSPVKMPAKL